ncbi:hypothetical protein ACWGLE_34050 [Streptomyces sp. NPDC055897]
MADQYDPVVSAYLRGQGAADVTHIPVLPAAVAAAGIGRPLVMTAAAWQEFIAGDGGGAERLRAVLSAIADRMRGEHLDHGFFVLPLQDLPFGLRPSGSDRLIASTDRTASEPIMILMLPSET